MVELCSMTELQQNRPSPVFKDMSLKSNLQDFILQCFKRTVIVILLCNVLQQTEASWPNTVTVQTSYNVAPQTLNPPYRSGGLPMSPTRAPVQQQVYFSQQLTPNARKPNARWDPVAPAMISQDEAKQIERYLKHNDDDIQINLGSMNARAPRLDTKFNTNMAPVAKKQSLILDKWAMNCIIKSTPITSRCEDHLIKRLHQDAREGRTAVDVERRVCCALFWHKDCINRVVVETCPDSSPSAADYLMGSRKLDLAMSCQRFNRDGCNSAPIQDISIVLWVLACFICSLKIVTLGLINN